MQKISTILTALLIACNTFSQSSINNLADVVVSVTDTKGKGTSGETVVFHGKKFQKSYTAVTGADGKIKISLPIGDDYTVTLKKLSDSTKYGVLTIPMLEADQFYTEPFAVNIEFQPAKNYTLNNVHFDFGKSSFKRESFPQLEELVAFLKNKPSIRIEIAGHTDNVGKPADNLKLSQDRSASIVKYLVGRGISASRLTAKGYGDTKPVADNSTDDGRRLNRRTEVILLD